MIRAWLTMFTEINHTNLKSGKPIIDPAIKREIHREDDFLVRCLPRMPMLHQAQILGQANEPACEIATR
jgi:hypothetical protein